MASRDSQGYLLAIIFLTILMILFGGIAVWMFMRSNELGDQLAAAEDKTTKAEERERTWIKLVEICKAQVGTADSKFGELTQLKNNVRGSSDQAAVQALKSLDESYQQIVGQKISTDDNSGANPTYMNVVESLSTVLSTKHNDLAVANNKYTTLQSQTKIDLAEKDEEITSITKKFTDAQDKLKTATADFNKTVGELRKSADEAKSTITQAGIKQNELITEHNKVRNQLETDMQKVVLENKELQTQLKKLTATNNSVPDGRIISVDKPGDFVQVNLGKADQLRIKQNFLVFDRSETNFETASPKAKIEITRVASDSDHIADARIHQRTAGDPILPGDHILSPTWDPGYRVPIAVAGLIDLDGDGRSDRIRFEGLVRQNGGTIVAIHDEDGRRRGEIDSNTRFLVTGVNSGKNPKINEAFSYYRKQAKEYNVEEMSVRRFINLMGVQVRGKTEHLDSGIGKNKQDIIDKKKFKPRSAFGGGR